MKNSLGRSGLRSARFALPGALLCAAYLAGCGGGGDDDDDSADGADDGGGEVSFSRDIAPVFAIKCNLCHHPNSATEMDLTDPFGEEGFISRQSIAFRDFGDDQEFLVDPGNPDGSFILTKVDGTELDPHVEGAPMPFETAYLDDTELEAVTDWIDAGAADDATFDPVAAIFGTQNETLRSGFGKCTLCHYAGSPPPRMDILDVFGENGLVDVAASVGGTRVVPGDSANSVLVQKLTGDPDVGEQMPLHLEPMTPDEVADLRAWIAAGAENN